MKLKKYLLEVPLSLNDTIVTNPPSSWIKAAMVAGLVDENHDAKANLMDAVNRGFSFDNIKSIVKLYLEHRFLDEGDADVFLSTLPIGTTNNEQTKEVTDQLLGDGEGSTCCHHIMHL